MEKRNRGATPTRIIDFDSLTKSLDMKNHRENMCGGQHHKILEMWKKLLDAFKATGCKLVFIADANIQKDKIDKWLSKRNTEFNKCVKFYAAISNGPNDSKNGIKLFPKKPSRFVLYGMAAIAQSYGQLEFSVKREADVEIMHQAKAHKAMAIISNDTDFLVFKGQWRLWSSDGIVRSKLKLTTFEYNNVCKVLSLLANQLPLFATLAGNDVTESLNFKLEKFFKKGPSQHKILNVAQFIREKCKNIDCRRISDSDIQQTAAQIFHSPNSEWEKLIKSSIESYDTDVRPIPINDPIEEKLRHTDMYTPYVENMFHIQSLNMQFYDLGGSVPETNLPHLLIDWVKRRKGVLMKNAKNPSSTFTLLVKKSVDDRYNEYEESVIDPNFPLPPLEELYSTEDLDESRWKIFGWIMVINDEVILVLKQLPKQYLLISTTLYILVKNRLVSKAAADGILYVENSIYEKRATDTSFPRTIKADNIRAAHLYNITFSAVRENFAITGLLPKIERIMQFDGVSFQRLMENVEAGNVDLQSETFLTHIRKYRIYERV